MKAKRVKRYKKALKHYCQFFKFRTPYQIILGGDFITQALSKKINFQKRLKDLLFDKIKLMTTRCILDNLRIKSSDGAIHSALMVSRKFEVRNCPHYPCKEEKECIIDLIGSKNKFKYFIASDNKELISKIEKIPGVPIITLNRSILSLRKLSKSSLDYINNLENSKDSLSLKEKEFLDKLIPIENKFKRLNLKKRAKGPNPLSVKKKKSLTN